MAATSDSAATNGHGNNGVARIQKLLAFHEQAAAAIRLTLGLLSGQASAAKTNGHATTLAQAVALDGARAAKSKPKRKGGGASRLRAQRARSGAVLEAFDVKTPRTAAEVAARLEMSHTRMGIGPLIRYGYLKRRRGGLVRTAKAYEVARPSK